MQRRTISQLAVVALLSAPASLLGGPDHIEYGDAGSLLGGAQTVYKNVLILQKLYGQLGPLRSDFEDMYVINIVDPEQFSARTDGFDGSFADFDSQLWLFRLNAGSVGGVLGNDNFGPATGSLIRAPSDDGTVQVLPGPGTYLLAISIQGSEPVSAGGPIFNRVVPTEISGPDGPGGMLPHSGWTTPPVPGSGSYVISITGAEGFPIVPGLSATGMGLLAVVLISMGAVLLRGRVG